MPPRPSRKRPANSNTSNTSNRRKRARPSGMLNVIPAHVLHAHVLPRLSNRNLGSWAGVSRAARPNARQMMRTREMAREKELEDLARTVNFAYKSSKNQGEAGPQIFYDVLSALLAGQYKVTKTRIDMEVTTQNFRVNFIYYGHNNEGGGMTTHFMATYRMKSNPSKAWFWINKDTSPRYPKNEVIPGPAFPPELAKIIMRVVEPGRRTSRRRTRIRSGSYMNSNNAT